MSLAPGARLGPYEILSPLGAGGMGEVYRARDTKLNRDVALKVLPESFANDTDRLARFKREAQVLASLNHPNIAAIYGLEDAADVKALVLELVEGPTLADRIAQGPIPHDEALPIARQIAEALEAAHEHAIVHRDLKPANIKLKADGTVKVLDFGLAKALSPAAFDSAQAREAGHYDNTGAMSQSPTVTSPAMTQMGIILGTAAYMSPEQARGKPVDKRTDIWAFGCVVYEMLTGRRAFEGEDVTVTVAAVVRGEPDWSALPSELPPAVRTTLQRCLSKDPKQRIRDIGDVSLALHGGFESVRDVTPATASARSASAKWYRMALTAVILVTSVIGGMAGWYLRRPSVDTPRIQRLSIALPPDGPLRAQGALAISPDGTRVVYVADKDGGSLLYLRQLDRDEAEPMIGTEGAVRPFFSPDGEWVAFFAEYKLKKVALGGGTPITLCDTGQILYGGSWGADDRIVFSTTAGSGSSGRLFRVAAAGGKVEPLTSENGEGASETLPQVLPGGKAILLTVNSRGGVPRIAVRSLENGRIDTIIEQGLGVRYVPSGHIVYLSPTGLMVVAFDPDRLTTAGSPVPLTESVSSPFGIAVSDNGTLVYGGPDTATLDARSLVWVDRQGRATAATTERAAYAFPRLSRDGQRVAVGIGDDIWVLDLNRRSRTRLTSEDRVPLLSNAERGVGALGVPLPVPAWTPDSQRVTFSSMSRSSQAEYALEWTNADGSGQRQILFKTKNFGQPGSWSSDVKTLVFYQSTGTSNGRDLWVFRPGNEPTPFLTTRFNERAPHLSPDGRWLAYVSNASGADEVYLRPFPASDAQQITVSTEGGTEPVWSRNGRELFYRSGARVMVVPVTLLPTLSLGQPRLLFEGPYLPGAAAVPFYDVAADGQRFLMVAGETSTSGPILNLNIVFNWFEELKQKTSAKPTP